MEDGQPKEINFEEDYIGQFISNKTLAEFDPKTGYWTLTSDVQEGRKIADNPWEFRTISIRSIDTLLEKAQETVQKAVYNKLKELEGNLWNLPDGEDDAPVPNVFENFKNTTA